MTHCANCDTLLEPAFRYCPHCGQSKSQSRFTLRKILLTFSQAVTDLDKGVLFLLRQLTIRPGVVAREYVL